MLQKSFGVHNSFMNPVVTPGSCILGIPFLPDHTLALPESFESVETSNVRFMTMGDADAALKRHEGIIRQELETPSELDRFCALPDSKSQIACYWKNTHIPLSQLSTTSRSVWPPNGIAKSMTWKCPRSSVWRLKMTTLEIGLSSL